MTTIIWIVIGMTIGLVSPWIIMHRHRLIAGIEQGFALPVRRRRVKFSSKVNAYHGVTIRPCLHACAAAAEQMGHRYLAIEAPELPLPGCDAGKCDCRYRYHEDRRENEDRRFEIGQISSIDPRSGSRERRSADGGDRRRSVSQTEPTAYFNDY